MTEWTEWKPHKPGDPCPVDVKKVVTLEVRLNGFKKPWLVIPSQVDWGDNYTHANIIAYRTKKEQET